jgi:putative nucleotidyltransferase with HDIG domain
MINLPRHHVASGNYFVGERQPLVLEAYLGTCVGVALHDPEAGIGGLSHLLLPEAISADSCTEPQKYAASGLPICLNELYEAGAEKARLRAYVAGGALVGPLDDRDLALDIGGRTADIVVRILTEAGIRIEKTETGGFFTCCLSLNLKNGQCVIQPVGEGRLEGGAEVETPTGSDINRVIGALKPIPQVALKIMRMVEDENLGIAALSEEIRSDQVISARTLSLCNSVMFSGREKIESVDHALVYVGLNVFIKMIITACLNNFFGQSEKGYSLCKGGLYHHAVGCAMISETIAKRTQLAQPGIAYTAGLLHDIGKVVLDQYVSKGYPLFYRYLTERDGQFVEAERKILKTDHTEIGAQLAGIWDLPESLTTVIRHHHCPEVDSEFSGLTHIVYLADLLMSRFHTGLELERLGTANLVSRLNTLGLASSDLPDIIDAIPMKVFEATPEKAIVNNG